MVNNSYHDEEEESLDKRSGSLSSASTTSLVLEHLEHVGKQHTDRRPKTQIANGYHQHKLEELDVEDPSYQYPPGRPVDRRARQLLWLLGAVSVVGWVLALVFFVSSGSYKQPSTRPHDPAATSYTKGAGKKITLGQVQNGAWRAESKQISWIAGANGEDGLLLERGGDNGDYLKVQNVANEDSEETQILMKEGQLHVNGRTIYPSQVWPSPDLRYVLIMSDYQRNWRHSYTGRYWILDVEHQTGQPLDLEHPDDRIQLASWSPQSDAIVFTRANNMFLRDVHGGSVKRITEDGGPNLFYGVPDWVYEEEVLAGNKATWWSEDGRYITFFRTNESAVPTYPVQYFLSRPSNKEPPAGQENYPDVRNIKYPKAGAPNPIVDLRFYDVQQEDVFSVAIEGDFDDLDRLITEVVWAGHSGKVIVKETNRESDVEKTVLYDVSRRTGKTVRELNVASLDGGWFEVSETTTFVPGDPGKGRPHDGYIDTVIHEGYDHLAYFTPLENPEPKLLTSGKWEVVKAPSAVDLENNLVYFVATKESSTQRHIYSVKLDGTDLTPLTDTTKEGYHSSTFSAKAGYMLLNYEGPDIPYQKVLSTPSTMSPFNRTISSNEDLAKMAAEHELPIKIYSTMYVDGFDINVVERRPPHFSSKKKYPVLFYLYGGPASQTVNKQFSVDFQSYVASTLNYIVVTVDGRGTGFMGRATRNAIRDNIGYYEAKDQIVAAKIWAGKRYVDENRIAIWGWSYGGFMTLKTLEQDAGQTFRYGMAVAPVTDWRLYDSIYTERYMHRPSNNAGGYDNATISNVTALSHNVRFLIMHGVSDDNVHFQNTLELLDRLDVGGVENYDVHVFPDSDHSIYFHNANRIVYDSESCPLPSAAFTKSL